MQYIPEIMGCQFVTRPTKARKKNEKNYGQLAVQVILIKSSAEVWNLSRGTRMREKTENKKKR